MLADSAFWVAVAFFLFLAFFIWKAVPGMLKGLDDRADAIRNQLDEARSLREESEKMLADYKHKHATAMTEAEQILDNAKAEAQNMRKKASADLSAMLERREKSALDKIAQAEANAEQDVKRQAVNYAMLATQQIMAKNTGAKEDGDLIKTAIGELSQRLQ